MLESMSCDLPAPSHRPQVEVLLVFVPVVKGDRVIGELSRGNELPNLFVKRSRWLEPLHENILQARQHLCCSAPKRALSGRPRYLVQIP